MHFASMRRLKTDPRERKRERERKRACSGKKFDLKPLGKKNGDEPMKARKGGG